MQQPENKKILEIIAGYEVLLFDAFGVLVDNEGPLKGAVKLIDKLNAMQKPYYILTNGSKYNLEETSLRYKKKGLLIEPAQIISSGSLIQDWVKANQLQGARTAVLGPESTFKLVQEAGLNPCHYEEENYDVFMVGDEAGFKLEDLGHIISVLFQMIDKGKKPYLLCPNPDIIFPVSEGVYHLTSGSIAYLIEKTLQVRYNQKGNFFTYLGKPFNPIFSAAEKKAPGKKKILIGDQLQTDIKGAVDFGIDSVLIGTGLNSIHQKFDEIIPTFVMQDLSFV